MLVPPPPMALHIAKAQPTMSQHGVTQPPQDGKRAKDYSFLVSDESQHAAAARAATVATNYDTAIRMTTAPKPITHDDAIQRALAAAKRVSAG